MAALTSAACGGASGKTIGPVGANTLRVLQMNLCDSGLATCYTGRSVSKAAAVIRADRPNIVTLNEVCRPDVLELKQAMADAEHGSVVVSAFEAALQEHSDHPYRCRNGQQYGIGVLAGVRRPSRGFATSGGHYPAQDPADTERRVWVCVHAPTDFYACTTHLSNTSRAVAISQCHYLMDTVIPAERARDRHVPVILGADLNLLDSWSVNPRSCIPPGFVRTDDGSRQDVVATAPLVVTSSGTIDMQGTTDHPGFLVNLAIARHRLAP